VEPSEPELFGDDVGNPRFVVYDEDMCGQRPLSALMLLDNLKLPR
jgi:hypothetical protein